MKRFENNFLSTIIIALCLTIFASCQGITNKNNSEEKKNVIKKTPFPPGWVDTNKTLKEKILTDYIISAKTIKSNMKNGQPFDKLDYDKLIAYDFAGSEEPYPDVIDKQGKFVPVILGQQYLSQEQADTIAPHLILPNAPKTHRHGNN